MVSKAAEEDITSPSSPRKAACRLATLTSQGVLPQKLGLAHPTVLCLVLWLCTLTKASLRSAACAMFKGLETNSPRTGIVCLIKQSRRAWYCTWEERWAGITPVQQSLARALLVPSPSCDNLLVRNALDHNQAHEGHRHGILSALYNVYGRKLVCWGI